MPQPRLPVLAAARKHLSGPSGQSGRRAAVGRRARKASAYFGLSPEAGGGDGRAARSWGVLRRNPRFGWYFAGSVTSDFGTWMANTAQVLLAYRLSHSVLFVGLVTCAQFTSPLLLGPCAGVLSDRFGGRRMLLATQFLAAAFAALMAGLALAGPINRWWLTVGAVGSGAAFTLALPARNVTVRQLVAADDAKPAFALDSVSYNLGRTLAPALSALLFTTFGYGHDVFGASFGANAVSFIAFAACLVVAGPGRANRPAGTARGTDGKTGGAEKSRLRDGFVAAGRDWRICVLLFMVASVTVADDPVLVVGPRLATQLHAGPEWSGIFIAALGAGTVLGSVVLPPRRTMSLRPVASALAALAACMILFVFSPVAWGSALAAFGAGAACLIANSNTRAQLAQQAGPTAEASVMAVWAIAWAGSKPLASLADGTIADTLGLKWSGTVLALPALVPFLIMVTLIVRYWVTRGQSPRPGPEPDRLSGQRSTPVALVEAMSQDAVKRTSELLGAH